MSFSDVLLMCGGVCWTFTYLAAIHLSALDHTHTIPFFAITLNLTWELIFTAVTPHNFPQRAIDTVWLLLDTVILIQAIRNFNHKSIHLTRHQFYIGAILSLLTAFSVQYALTVQMDGQGFYSAFTINLYMSIAFVLLLFNRKPRLAGQNQYIAIAKMTGTALSSLSFYLSRNDDNSALADVYLYTLYLLVLVWDVLYVGLIVHMTGSRCWRWRLSVAVLEEETDSGELPEYMQVIA